MNNCMLIGNLTADPELRYTHDNTPVCKFTLAVSRAYKGADGKQLTDFIPIVVWRAIGQNCAKYLKKGSKAAVLGELNIRSYEGEDGVKRYVSEIIARSVEFLSSPNRSGGTNAGGVQEPHKGEAGGEGQYQQSFAPNSYGGGATDANGFTQVTNDELPF